MHLSLQIYLTVSPSETSMSALAPLAFEITDFVFGISLFNRPGLHHVMVLKNRTVLAPVPVI